MDKEKNPKAITQNLIQKFNIVYQLYHPSIIKLIGFSPKDFKENSKPVLITEYMANGSLNNLIEQERRGLYNPKYNAKKNSLLYWESLLQ